jgi:hypothetical protein
VIHAAGVVYRDGKHGEEALLHACYTNSLKRAIESGCESVAFPLISSGIYGYPKSEALRVATSAIQEFLEDHDIDVYLAVFDREAFAVSKELLGEIEAYIDEHYVVALRSRQRSGNRELLDVEVMALNFLEVVCDEAAIESDGAAPKDIEDVIGNLDEPFSNTLLRLIDARGRTDVEIYKRANIDRKHFSKIRTAKGYMPSKRTAIALAIALELSLDETDDLLERAGYALSHSQIFDVIVEYFIVNGKHDIYEINEVLFKYDQPLLGS